MLLKLDGHKKRWAGVTLATATVGLAAMMVTAAVAAPVSDAAKAKVDSGHWGGSYGSVWIPGPYEKSHKANPQLSDAAKAKMSKGHWGGKTGSTWIGSDGKPQ